MARFALAPFVLFCGYLFPSAALPQIKQEEVSRKKAQEAQTIWLRFALAPFVLFCGYLFPSAAEPRARCRDRVFTVTQTGSSASLRNE